VQLLDVGKLGLIRRRRKPEIAGSNPAIQTKPHDERSESWGFVIVPWRTSRSGRHPLKVKIVGSNPIQGTECEMARWWNWKTRSSQKAVPTEA
jgi:hypothetical protein